MKKNKYIHFSVDDVIDCFEEIHKSGYYSLFENAFFLDLRTLHEEIGLKVSLYCYYHNGSFSLDQFGQGFLEEFRRNSNWLKLGVHAFDSDVAKNDDWRYYYISYIRVMDELVRIAGEEAIDFCPRLDSYKLPIETWNKLAELYEKCPQGLLIDGLGGANNYFLNMKQIKSIKRYGKIYLDGKPMICTTMCLEKNLKVCNKLPQFVYTHEWIWGEKRIELMQRIKQLGQGGRWIFPLDLL